MKILIVDDEQLDMFISKKLLSLEFDVEAFTTVPEALAWAQQNDFDVALIDYYLAPEVFAQDLLRQLIALKGPTFKPFVLSNFVDEKQIRELREAGFSEIIYKPLTLEKFKELI